MGHARALLALDGRQQESTRKRVADEALFRAPDGEAVNRHPSSHGQDQAQHGSDRDVARLEEELSEAIGTQVEIKPGKKARGKLASVIRITITWTTSCPKFRRKRSVT